MAKEQVEATFAGRLTSVAACRAFVEATLAAWDCNDTEQIAVLLTSELVTNAIVHVGSDFRVRLVLGEADLEVEVADASTALPELRSVDSVSEGGRGLWLVQRLANVWGTRLCAKGKVVWFRLPLGPLSRLTPPPS